MAQEEVPGCGPTPTESITLRDLEVQRRTLLAGAGGAALLAALGLDMIRAPTASAAVQYQFPFPIRFYDIYDTYDNGRGHRGIDFNGNNPDAERWLNTTDRPGAVADGDVVHAGWTSDCLGNGVVLRHDDGWYSGYFHLSSIANLPSRVGRGTPLGNIGKTGSLECSTGVHLHLTIGANYSGAVGGGTHWVDHTDPFAFISARLSGPIPEVPKPPTMEDSSMRIVRDPAGHHYAIAPGFIRYVVTADLANYMVPIYNPKEIGLVNLTEDWQWLAVVDANALPREAPYWARQNGWWAREKDIMEGITALRTAAGV